MTSISSLLSSTGVQAVLGVIEGLLPYALNAINSDTIGKIITVLQQIWPEIEAEISDLATPVRNIIAALSGSAAATPDQLAALKALDQQTDAAFDAALADFNAAHPAA